MDFIWGKCKYYLENYHPLTLLNLGLYLLSKKTTVTCAKKRRKIEPKLCLRYPVDLNTNSETIGLGYYIQAYKQH